MRHRHPTSGRCPTTTSIRRSDTSPQGLTEDEAFARLASSTARTSCRPRSPGPIIYKFFDQFTSLFAIMLEVAAVLVFIAAMLSTGASRQDNINVTIAILASSS